MKPNNAQIHIYKIDIWSASRSNLNIWIFSRWATFAFAPTLNCTPYQVLYQVSNTCMVQFMASHVQINANDRQLHNYQKGMRGGDKVTPQQRACIGHCIVFKTCGQHRILMPICLSFAIVHLTRSFLMPTMSWAMDINCVLIHRFRLQFYSWLVHNLVLFLFSFENLCHKQMPFTIFCSGWIVFVYASLKRGNMRMRVFVWEREKGFSYFSSKKTFSHCKNERKLKLLESCCQYFQFTHILHQLIPIAMCERKFAHYFIIVVCVCVLHARVFYSWTFLHFHSIKKHDQVLIIININDICIR